MNGLISAPVALLDILIVQFVSLTGGNGMKSKISRSFLRILAVLALVSGLSFWAIAQRGGDPNYESPTPILLSEIDSTRALTQNISRKAGLVSRAKFTPQAYAPDTKIVLYVSDLQLLPGEGANAFRIYATDSLGHSYRFPVLDIQSSDRKNVWALTILLTDETGYWGPLAADGDVLVYLTWRGLASNEVKIGIGKTGGEIKERATARPTPIGTTAKGDTSYALSAPIKKFNDRARFLEQATFGPVRNFDDQFLNTRVTTWINNQFNLPYPSAANPYPSQVLKPVNAPADCDNEQTITPDIPVTCFRDTYTLYPLQTWNGKEMLYGDAQLHHKVTWALSQIWVTSGVDVQQSRHMVEWHKILSANAFGNYRTLMKQMTLSPTMGDYLSMSQSTRNSPNENYAREIQQLFTIGLFMLNQDGTVICVEHNPCQAGDNIVPSYDQNNVNSLTKVLTGWKYCQTNPPVTGPCPNVPSGAVNFIDPMLLNQGVTTLANNLHDLNAKTLLSYPGSTTTTVAACGAPCAATPNATGLANISTYANASLDQAIDNLFNHPNVGPFVSKLLIQQMVTSSPTPAYVGRVAAVFNDNGTGVRGDMKSVITAILLDPEARGSNKTDPNYGKLREPFQFAANIMRAFNVRDAAGTGQSEGYINVSQFTGMGQTPFRSPTVFNYYPPDFVIPGTTLVGPEFALMTTGTAIQRANFANRMTFTSPAINNVPVNVDIPNGTSLDYSDLQALVAADTTGNTLMDELNRRMMHGTMSAAMRSTILTAVTAYISTDTINRVRQAVYLVATSSQYQVQR